MDSIDISSSNELTWMLLALAAAVILAAVGVVFWRIRRRSERRDLARRFGPEYDRLVQEYGSAERAEAELTARARRVRSLSLKDLSGAERQSFSEAWRQTQERFVDTPLIAVRAAHDLVQQVMRARGYPVDDFEQRVADLSVDHAPVVEHYRAAHALHESNTTGRGNTEELRQAMVHYRALFADLLGAPLREPGARGLTEAHA